MSSARKRSGREKSPAKISRRDSREQSGFVDNLGEFADYVTYNLPPGPAFLPQWWYVDLHKGGMPFYLFAMMAYFDNWSMGAYMYLALHGSYGKIFTFDS